MNYKAINKEIIDNEYARLKNPLIGHYDALKHRYIISCCPHMAYCIPEADLHIASKDINYSKALDQILEHVRTGNISQDWNLYQYECEIEKVGKHLIRLWNANDKSHMYFNKKYLKNFSKNVTFYAFGPKHPVYLYSDGKFEGIILPVHINMEEESNENK